MHMARKYSKANHKLIDNLIVSRAVVTGVTIESASFWIEAATDCVLSVTE
jgi:hypothetical protein